MSEWMSENPEAKSKSGGAIIMAGEFDKGVLIGVSSRVTDGNYVRNPWGSPLIKLTDNIYCCGSGDRNWVQKISKSVASYLDYNEIETGRIPTVKEAARMIQLWAQEHKKKMGAEFVVAGIDESGPHVYSIVSGGAMIKETYAVVGVGSTCILGLAEHLYKKGLSESRCRSVIRTCIEKGMKLDDKAGGECTIQLVTMGVGAKESFVLKLWRYFTNLLLELIKPRFWRRY